MEIAKPAAERKALRAARLDGLQAPTTLSVPLGIATGGQTVWLDLADERAAHVVIGGTTGSGKSVALAWILYRLCKQNTPAELRIIALDPKRRELANFGRVPHLLHPPVSNPVETARLLAWVGAELDRRAQSGQVKPALLVVVEEVADLAATNADVSGLLARIAQIGRGLGVHLIVTTQQPGARALGDSLVNFPARLLGRVASQTLTFGAAGRARTGAGDLLGRGDMLWICGAEVTRLQTPLLDGRQFASLPTGGPGSLGAELPSLALFADRARDPRGGHTGRRELGPADYSAIEAALQDGAGPDDLRGQFGIGWARALRLYSAYRGTNETG